MRSSHLRVPSSLTWASITAGRPITNRAASHGRSVEEEAEEIVKGALAGDPTMGSIIAAIRRRMEPFDGVELEIPPREPMRRVPDCFE